MTSWRRPSNRSSRLTSPSGPSNPYSFSTAIHGIRRRSAASASRARVCSFSLTSSSSRARCHSSGVTIGGAFMAFLPSEAVDAKDILLARERLSGAAERSGVRRRAVLAHQLQLEPRVAPGPVHLELGEVAVVAGVGDAGPPAKVICGERVEE